MLDLLLVNLFFYGYISFSKIDCFQIDYILAKLRTICSILFHQVLFFMIVVRSCPVLFFFFFFPWYNADEQHTQTRIFLLFFTPKTAGHLFEDHHIFFSISLIYAIMPRKDIKRFNKESKNLRCLPIFLSSFLFPDAFFFSPLQSCAILYRSKW